MESLRLIYKAPDPASKHKKHWIRGLKPGGSLDLHKDPKLGKGVVRMWWPMQTHPDVKVTWPSLDAKLHMEPGVVYQLKTDVPHTMTNPTEVDCYHLVVEFVKNEKYDPDAEYITY